MTRKSLRKYGGSFQFGKPLCTVVFSAVFMSLFPMETASNVQQQETGCNLETSKFEKSAREKIVSLLGAPEGEYSVNLFVEHHLHELPADYFAEHFDTIKPEPLQTLAALVLKSCWSSEDDGIIDTYDFTLPGKVTDYVLAVRFNGNEIVSVEMES